MTGSPDIPDIKEAAPLGNNTARWIWIGAVALFIVAAGLYFSFSTNPVIVKYRELARFYSNRKEVRQFLVSVGPNAPIVFILLQALQVVMAPVPGEATGVLGGYVFGTGLGFLYSTIGLTLGSALAFGLGRWLGLPLVRRIVSEKVYHKFDFLARAGGEMVILLLFILPGFPKDYLCFLLGVSPMPFGMFLVITTFGRMPGTWLLSIQGANLGKARYLEFVIFLTLAAAAAVPAYIYRERIFQWMRQRHGKGAGRDDRDPMSL
jgi:uncharacterized membrane protein YdjX (TVP38/TMEM64 family)